MGGCLSSESSDAKPHVPPPPPPPPPVPPVAQPTPPFNGVSQYPPAPIEAPSPALPPPAPPVVEPLPKDVPTYYTPTLASAPATEPPATPPAVQDNIPHMDEQAHDPVHLVGGATKVLTKMADAVMNGQAHDQTFEKIKRLGQGGFGVVWLCKATGSRHDKRRMPEYFAMKELSSNKLFRPGRDKNIRDYLPLNEPSIQQYMKHEAIVETYWADVRCLDPKTDRPLEIGAKDLEGNAWLSLDHLEDIERTYTEAAGGAAHRRTTSGRVPEAVKLQMRIAMEHCDLASLKDYLVDPDKPPTKSLAEEISWKRGSKIDKTRCALLTALDIAEALKFMHKAKTLHGDLKPHNILLVTDMKDEKLFRAKISDFGLSAHMTAGQTSVSISQGTEAYLPKEVFQNLAITEASDIYALGLLMWEIFYGIFWFIVWDTEKRRKNVRLPQHMDGYRPSCSPSCPKDFASIIHECLSSNPESRPSAGEVVSRLINVIGQYPGEANR